MASKRIASVEAAVHYRYNILYLAGKTTIIIKQRDMFWGHRFCILIVVTTF